MSEDRTDGVNGAEPDGAIGTTATATGEELLDRALALHGDARLRALEEAIATFREELGRHGSQPPPSGELRHQLGVALIHKARLASGEAALETLASAVTVLNEALEVRTLESAPVAYATTKRYLGHALCDQAFALAGEQKQLALARAIAAYREALELLSLEATPRDHAATQESLGIALGEHAGFLRRKPALEGFRSAIAALQAALVVYAIDTAPSDFARVQINLGLTLIQEARVMRRRKAAEAIALAITAYEEALRVHTLEKAPIEYSNVCAQIGTALRKQAPCIAKKHRPRKLASAVRAYRAALAGDPTNPAIYSLLWGALVAEGLVVKADSRASVLEAVMLAQKCAEGLEEAESLTGEARRERLDHVEILKQRLLSWTNPVSVMTVGMGRNSGASGNGRDGAIASDKKLLDRALALRGDARLRALEEAIASFREELGRHGGRPRESAPVAYATTKQYLGHALHEQACALAGEQKKLALVGAIAAYREALEVFSLEALPSDYAATQEALGIALGRHAELLGIKSTHEAVRSATASLHAALAVYTIDATPSDFARVQIKLGLTLAQEARILTRPAAARTIALAIAAYQEALRVHTLDDAPIEYGDVCVQIGNALREQASCVAKGHRPRKLASAVGAYRDALAGDPTNPAIYSGLLMTLDMWASVLKRDSRASVTEAITLAQKCAEGLEEAESLTGEARRERLEQVDTLKQELLSWTNPAIESDG